MEFDEMFMMNQDFEDSNAGSVELAVEVKESSRRGRKPGKKSSEKLDIRAKLERSRQSARECRARKKLRYQYLEELVTDREKAVFSLRQELEKLKTWCHELDEGRVPEGFQSFLEDLGIIKEEQ
ncbi:REPTOR-binding partner isoform X1 [Planococcus citri]|uniref:REPTOR-binding partner isoform X1 n=1 Tax=Planococcus citri TaxID=170843 RepID=UPI0031F9E204